MAKVPDPYIPDHIASPAVGTPPLDTSGAKIGSEIAGSLEQINQQRYERQLLGDKITANNAINTLDQQARSIRNQTNKSYFDAKDENGNPIIATPEQQQDAIVKSIQTARDTIGKTMTTVGQKNAFALGSMEVMKSHQDAAYNDGLTRQTQQVHSMSLNAINTSSSQIYGIFADPDMTMAQKFEELHKPGGVLDMSAASLNYAQKFLPADEFHKLQEMAAKSHALSAIYGSIESNPNDAIEMMKKGGFADAHLTPQDKVYLERSAQQKIERDDKQAALNLSLSTNTTTQKLWTGLHAGTTRLADIAQARADGLIGQPEQKALTDILYSKKALDPTEKLETYNNLVEEQGTLFKRDSAGKFTGAPSKEAVLANMALFRQHVMEAERSGAISQAKSESLAKATQPSLDEKALEAIKSSIDNKKAGSGFFGMFADQYIKTPEDQTAAKAFLTHTLSKQIDDAEAQGQKLTPTDVKAMSQTILKDYITKNYPQTMNAKDVPNNTLTQNEGPQQLHGMPSQAPAGSQKISGGTKEGQTATNKATGEQVVYKGGKWVPKT